MDVTLKTGVWIEVPKMLKAIKDSGYPPIDGDVRITVGGTIRKQGEQYSIELDAMQKPLSLPLVFEKSDDKTPVLVAAQTDKPVTLQGFWQSDAKAASGVLRVSSVEEIKQGEAK